MVVLYRIMMMVAGYSAACVAASLVLTIGTLAPQWSNLGPTGASPDLQSVAVWSVSAVGAAVLLAIAILPKLLVIAIAEGLALRSAIVYGVIGGALALAAAYGLNSYGFEFAGTAGPVGPDFAREREVIAAAGIAGGLVYWLFAGRKAGSWK